MLLKNLKHYLAPFFFLIGIVLLVHLVRRFGVHELYQTMLQVGPNIGWVMGIPLFWNLAHTLGWYFVLEETGNHISFWQLLRLKLIGETVNTITPISFMGGDPVRIYFLQKNMPGTLSTASVILDRTMQSFAVVIFVLIGLVVAWFQLLLPSEWKYAFPMLVLFMMALVWFFIHRQKKGIFDFLSNGLTRFGFKKHLTESIQNNIDVIDERISRFYHHSPKRFVIVVVCHLLGRFMGMIEIYIIASFLQLPLGLTGALFLATLTVLVNLVFVFIPGSMGVLEGAYGALLHLMEFNPLSGVALQLVRRLRTLCWVLVGLLLMLVKKPGEHPV